MNTQQSKTLHTLLSKTGLMNSKKDLILGFTHGRAESSKDLTEREAAMLIAYLQRQKKEEDPCNRMRRKIISMCYELRWAKAGDWKTALEKIDSFCEGAKGIYKKKLQTHTYQELVQVVSQFESIYKKYLEKL